MKLTNFKTLGKIAITGLIASILPMSVNAKDTVKVGVVSFLTGPAAGPFGTPAKQGAEIVIDAINSGTMPAYTNLDLRVDRAISLGGLTANAYISVFNALDSEQVNDVYHGTGNVAEDGWVATESGQQWLANRLSQNPDVDAAAMYQDNLAFPGRWNRPRTVRVGLNISF